MRAKRTDDNHLQVMNYFRSLGYSVKSTHMVGDGFTDIVIANYGFNFIIEVKDGNKPKSQQKLTPAEKNFRDKWKGQYTIITCMDDVINFDNKVRAMLIDSAISMVSLA